MDRKLCKKISLLFIEIQHDFKYLITHPISILIALSLIGWFLFSFRNLPPTHIVMTSGTPYFSQRYKQFFERYGIKLEIRPSNGSEENAKRLMDPNDPTQIGFIYNGTIDQVTANNISTMGTVNYAPVWLFYRKNKNGIKFDNLKDFATKRVNINVVGSGTNTLLRKILKINGIELGNNFTQLDTDDAYKAFKRGEIDAIFLIASPHAESIQSLARDADIEIYNFKNADAYSFSLIFIEKIIIPEGSLDIPGDIPKSDIQLITTTDELVVKNNLHPSIQMLLMRAAKEIHGQDSFFVKKDYFPRFGKSALPENEEAKIFYWHDVSFITNYLPFWTAEILERMLFYLIPVVIFIFPISSYFLSFRVNRGLDAINRLYSRLFELENRFAFDSRRDDVQAYINEIDEIKNIALKLCLPSDVLNQHFMLLRNIDFTRESFTKSLAPNVSSED